MERTLGRSCLILALLGLLIAVTLLVSPSARADIGTAAVQTMQLQGNPDGDSIPATSEQAEKTEWCEQDDQPRLLKHELAFLLAEYAQAKGKNFRASHDVNTAKSKH
jgi:hypothetical protein